VQSIRNATTTTAKSWPAALLSPLLRHLPLPRPRLTATFPRHLRPRALPKGTCFRARPLPRHWQLPTRPKHLPLPKPTPALPRLWRAHSLPKRNRFPAPLLRHGRRGVCQRGFGSRRKRGQVVRLREAHPRRRGKRGTRPTPLPRAPDRAHRPLSPRSKLPFLEESYRTYRVVAAAEHMGG
jgi:hypothetical protein